MKNQNRLRLTLGFLAGVAVTLAVTFGFFNTQDARASSSCIKTDLDAYKMNGDIPSPNFTILYRVPSCYAENGYKAVNAYMRGNDVAVTYEKQ